MSCDVTKLDYLNETKQIIRNILDPDGTMIKDETPFREYTKFMGGLSITDVAFSSFTPETYVVGNATKEDI